MSTLNPITDKYMMAQKQYNEAIKKYSGDAGLGKATDYATNTAIQNAKQSALASSLGASNQASLQARNQGLTGMQSALLGANAGASNYSSSYGNAFNQLYNQGLSTASNMYGKTTDSAMENLKTNQAEGQAEYDRTVGLINNAIDWGGKALSVTGETVKKIPQIIPH